MNDDCATNKCDNCKEYLRKLRVAVEALTAVGYAGSLVTAGMQATVCKNALAAIGDLPE